MSQSGNFSSSSDSGSFTRSGGPITSPSDDTPAHTAHGNFLSSSTRSNFSSANPIVTGGRPVFITQAVQPSPVHNKSHDIVPDLSNIYDGYKSEAKRLETFYDWPSTYVKKEELARNGFIYLHSSDRAQCIFCRGVLSGWEPGDVVEHEHKRHCPECPFAFGYECGNIPLNNGITLHRTNVAESRNNQFQNTAVKNAWTVQQQSYTPTNSVLQSNIPDSRPIEMGSLLPALPSANLGQPRTGEATTSEPKYREWGDEYKRIRSFRGWPTQMTQTPIELAKAGLLYMGNGDRCKCFWCGGELYDWEPQDKPWEEHAKWFPHCGYVRGVKGDNYIQYVRDLQNGVAAIPPVESVMRNPHVLAVLREGYTEEQVREAFARNGHERLYNAQNIVAAIHEINRERIAAMNMINSQPSNTGTQETEHEEMDIEETASNQRVPAKENSTASNTVSGEARKSTTAGTINTEVESVQRENAKLKDEKLCKICMDKELCMTFLPCGHLATCEECAASLTECPICRKQIMQRVKIFWA